MKNTEDYESSILNQLAIMEVIFLLFVVYILNFNTINFHANNTEWKQQLADKEREWKNELNIIKTDHKKEIEKMKNEIDVFKESVSFYLLYNLLLLFLYIFL